MNTGPATEYILYDMYGPCLSIDALSSLFSYALLISRLGLRYSRQQKQIHMNNSRVLYGLCNVYDTYVQHYKYVGIILKLIQCFGLFVLYIHDYTEKKKNDDQFLLTHNNK